VARGASRRECRSAYPGATPSPSLFRTAAAHSAGLLAPERGRGRGRGPGGIVGHWIQATTVASGSRYASPVLLTRAGSAERWRGDIDPLADEFTMYLRVDPNGDGSLRAFLKIRAKHRPVPPGRRPRAPRRCRALARRAHGGTKGEVLAEGVLREACCRSPCRGDVRLRHVEASAASDFYPRSHRGRGPVRLSRAPRWTTAGPWRLRRR